MSHENDFLPRTSLKFSEIGDTHKGRLVCIGKRQDRDIKGNPKSFDNGEPMHIYTWELMQDDGTLGTVWVKGNLYAVLKEAVAKSGAKSGDDLKGALVQIKHHALGEKKSGLNQAKLYQAKITLMDAAERAKFAAANEGASELPVDQPDHTHDDGDFDPFPSA